MDLAAIYYKFVLTCFYSTMPEIQLSLKVSGVATLFGSKEWFDELIKLEGSFLPLKTYVCFDKFEAQDYNLAKAKGIDLISF